MKPPGEKRLGEWRNEINQTIGALMKQKKLTSEYLSKNPTFITALIEATPIALKTHQSDKRRYLSNMIANSALPNAPDDDLRKIYFRLIDEFTSSHIKILQFFQVDNWYKELGFDVPAEWTLELVDTLMSHFTELNKSENFARLLLDELYRYHLITISSSIIETDDSFQSNLLTDIGRQFVEFITSSLNDEYYDRGTI